MAFNTNICQYIINFTEVCDNIVFCCSVVSYSKQGRVHSVKGSSMPVYRWPVCGMRGVKFLIKAARGRAVIVLSENYKALELLLLPFKMQVCR